MRIDRTFTCSTFLVLLATSTQAAQSWSNYGGGNARNGQTELAGPDSANLIWSNTDDFSIISWHPFVEDGRVITVREAGFPTNGGGAGDAIVAYDLYSGTELWRTTMSFGGDTNTEWIAWIGGVRDGRVYASRSSNQKPQPLRAYDAATGALLWSSALSTEAWAHDGIVYAPNGDLIVGDFRWLSRIDHTDGSTVWSVPRLCPVSGNCGAAANETAVYIDESVGGGNQLTKFDIATGARLYSSPVMPGFTDQNSPFLSADGGTVYFSRTQNNTLVDFLFAFSDTGTGFVELWNRDVRWTTSHEHGIAADGSIYTFTQADEFVRLDPNTGAITANAGVLSPIGSPNLSPKTAVDTHGRVYVSNGWASNPASDGRMWAFDGDLTTTLFTVNLDRQNSGGPILAGDGILVLCDRSGVYAYRNAEPGASFCAGDGNPAACPCGNNGGPGEGCANSTNQGGLLSSSGSTRVALDDLVLTASQLPANRFGLIFSGTDSVALNFGDGIRCVGGAIQRYGIQNSGAAGVIAQSNVASLGGLNAGDTRDFQCWYRDTGGPCSSGFNVSNAQTVSFRP